MTVACGIQGGKGSAASVDHSQHLIQARQLTGGNSLQLHAGDTVANTHLHHGANVALQYPQHLVEIRQLSEFLFVITLERAPRADVALQHLLQALQLAKF